MNLDRRNEGKGITMFQKLAQGTATVATIHKESGELTYTPLYEGKDADYLIYPEKSVHFDNGRSVIVENNGTGFRYTVLKAE